MSARRSSRLKAQDATGQVDIQPSESTVQPPASSKRKTPATKAEPSTKKKRVATSSTRKNQELPGQASLGPSSRSLLSLLAEIFDMILHNIKDPATLSKLSKTCQRYYSLAAPQLYKTISASAPHHANIAKLIRILEPHLTIRQAQQLKKEGKYRGQSESFSSTIDPDKKPSCSGHVQQIVIGYVNPGRKHDYIVHRYVEEAFKNMANLEVVETRVLTESITQSLARLQGLKALNLIFNDLHNDKFKSLVNITNLQHLRVDDNGYGRENPDEENTIQSLLRNSRSTLRSLAINNSPYNTDFFHNWESNTPKGGEAFEFVALKLFALTAASLDSDVVKSLTRTIDFVELRELTLGRLYEGKDLLIKALTTLLLDAQGKGRVVKIQALSMDFQVDEYDMSSADKQAIVDAQCSLISSFNTLTSLVLLNYSQETGVEHGLSDSLLQAVLKHEQLTKLRIYDPISNLNPPYLSPMTITSILTGLPHLREFEFTPQADKHEEVGRALALGTSLTSISVFLAPSRSEDPGLNQFKGIVKGCLSRNHHNATGAHKWEDHCNLRRVFVHYRTWELASEFGKGKKGMKKAEKITGDGGREVMCREVTDYMRRYIHEENVVVSDWVEKISGDLS